LCGGGQPLGCRGKIAVEHHVRADVGGNLLFVVRVNFVGQKKTKKLTTILYYNQLLNLSRATKYGKSDIRPVPVLSDYLVKLVIPASRAILKPAVIYRVVSLRHTT